MTDPRNDAPGDEPELEATLPEPDDADADDMAEGADDMALDDGELGEDAGEAEGPEEAEEAEEPEEPEAEPAPAPRRRPSKADAARSAAKGRTAYAIDPALRIRDRTSTIFVAGSTLVFVGIFLFAMGFGKGGAFTPVRTPPPIVSPSPGASPSASPVASPSGAPSATPPASPSDAPTPTAAPASPEVSPAAS